MEQMARVRPVKFHLDKCKVMEKNNPNYVDSVMGSELAATSRERILRVLVDRTVKASAQCAAAVTEAKRTLAIIRKGIKDLIIYLSTNPACPLLHTVCSSAHPVTKGRKES